ncbi:hypothetical protein [Burkholderia ambifaria]|jgi:hypothetical protein|uniref:hypothetical protein n=1 Tax=Burkholderia ambifaria TaxID=152480 RepID=UPI001588D3F7|nr:hypothetical protein [Burkholderia ambifaria]
MSQLVQIAPGVVFSADVLGADWARKYQQITEIEVPNGHAQSAARRNRPAKDLTELKRAGASRIRLKSSPPDRFMSPLAASLFGCRDTDEITPSTPVATSNRIRCGEPSMASGTFPLKSGCAIHISR